MMKNTIAYSALCATLLLVGAPRPAEAYLDPGTGSIVIQVVVGGVLAVLATTRLYWNRIVTIFRRDRKQ
jgi:hypothetical protein